MSAWEVKDKNSWLSTPNPNHYHFIQDQSSSKPVLLVLQIANPNIVSIIQIAKQNYMHIVT